MIARFSGNEELVDQLVELFVVECPRMMHEVRRSIESGSADALRQAAHSFKGCVANFDHAGAVAAAHALEAMARDGNIGAAPEALARLEQEVSGLLQAMQNKSARVRTCVY
jgi:HPt (histidine-containing phosphotransfer) domain-containing protein